MPATAANRGKTGLLLINLGTPDAPEPAALRRYLRQFLSDRRVVEIPPLLWQPILNLFILTTRPRRSAAAYRRIWGEDSPLRAITAAQATALAETLAETLADSFPDLCVDYAMRYGEPSIESRIHALHAQGVDHLLLAPLYPQYSSATTGTALAEAFAVLAKMRWMPAVSTLPPYWRHPAYIAALKTSLDEELAKLSFIPERIILSFHGMPARVTALGDPYQAHCEETAQLLRAATGHNATTMPLAYQSRFGRARWLQPYLLPTLVAAAENGLRRVAILTPGFSADCLETLDELGNELCHAFLAAGGTEFAVLPCLNASRCSIELLRRIITPMLEGGRATV